MKDNFQSKAYGGARLASDKHYGLGLPRHWRVITSTLLLLFTFAIGNVWAEEVKLVSVGNEAVSMIANVGTAPDFFNDKTYKSGDESYSVTISLNAFTTAQGSEYKPDGVTKYKDYYYNVNSTCDMSGTPANYIKVSATNCKISKIVVRGACASSTIQPLPAVGFVNGLPETTTIGSNAGRRADVIISDQTCSYTANKRFDQGSAATYTFSTNVSEVYFSKQFKKVALPSASAWSSVPSSSQTYCVFGMDVYVVPATAPANYTVTLNPNGGSYASTPEGWTESAGKYTKSVTAGALAIPTPTQNNYDFAGWKSGLVDVALSNGKLTVSKDTTLTAQWTEHVLSDDATLSDLTVGGETVSGFAPATLAYNVELPFGTSVVPTVAGTANSTYAKSVVVTPAASLPGSTTVVVTAEDNSTETYTVNFTVADSKDIRMAWATSVNFCSGAEKYSSAVKSDNALVSAYINKITFTNVEGSGDDGAEGGSLNVGKKAGNMFTLSAKPGYAMKAMTFAAKIQDANCEYSLNGGAWQTLTSTGQSADKCYEVFADAEVHEFRLRSTGASGVWIRNMELDIIAACTPKTIVWTAEPAAEYEVGKAGYAIAASANNGDVEYAASNGAITVAANGALTINSLTNAINLSASVAAGDGTTYCATGASVVKESIKTYYLVKLDAQNETAVTEVKYFSGDDAIALPTPSYSGYDFQGWFDAKTGGNQYTAAITPAASMTVYAQWVAQCDGATITTQPTGANYITGRIPANLVCEATAGNGGALTYEWFTCDDALKTNPVAATATPSTAVAGTFYYFCKVTEAGCDVEAFSDVVTITVADKDPVCIIKATPTAATEATADGAYKGSAFFKGSNAKKLSSGYDYAGVQLMAGKSFLATDKVVLNQAADLGDASDITKFYVFTETPASGKSYATVDNATPKKGDNWFAMPAELVGESSLYIGRVDAKCNPTLGYLAVYRVMMPELMAIKIAGRDGEIDALNDKHFNVTIPYEAVLTSLTVVPTIVRNAAHATTPEAVISNEGAWVLGDNTYRVMDKDGDYTDYTITLTRDVLKHAVKFYNGENVYATVEVVDGEQMAAGDVPADPTDEDNIFQGWAETAGGDAVDVTLFTISAAKNFYAKWVSDGAIKLIVDGTSGKELNTSAFYTGAELADDPVEVETVNYNYAILNGTASSPSGVNALNKLIAYNATTTQTKVMVNVYNSSTSGRNVYIKGVLEGSDQIQDLANIALDNSTKKHVKSEYYEFNNTANRTIYISVPSSANTVYFLQVKVIESGDPLKKAGEAGYSLNMNKGRMFASTEVIDGATLEMSSAYSAVSSSVAKFKETSISFDVAAPVTLTVTAANDKTYYVTKGAAGTDNETAKTGASDFDLTAGTWFITAGGSEVQLTNIAFSAPKCAEPVIDNDPESNPNFGPGNLTASVTAHATDGATLAYQWYDASDDSEVSGATDATLTTTTEGTYYVIITASKAGYDDRSVQSANATLGYRDLTIATLSALSYGGTAITLEADKYEYRVDLAENTTEVPALAATATQAAYGATAVPTDATEFVNYEAISTVLVTAEDGTTTQTYTVHFYVDHIYTALVDVTESTTWNWTGSEEATINDVANKGLILANYIDGLNFEKIEGKEGERARRDQNDGVYQGTQLHFNTTVYGKVKIYFRAPSSGEECVITIKNNGKEMKVDSTGNSFKWSREVVVYGDVVIEMVNKKEGKTDTRVQQIVFTQVAPDYTREVSNNIGTLCVDHNVLAGGALGATFYQIASRNEQYNDKIDFEEVLPNEELKAGEPYIFKSTTGKIELFYGATVADAPVAVRGMIGSFVDAHVDITSENMSNILYIASNKLWNCEDMVGSYLDVVANRAYIVMSDVPTYADYQAAQTSNPAPRRRVTLGKNAEQVVTGVENLNASEQPVKLLINGQIFILRGEKLFDATGRLVK